MKILHIRLQNLNSLTGTWHIDFTDPAYAENNLFAITGPTGAGKSTLLDAVCLALYGQTPRLGKISKSSNQIMSRHTGICFAEVEFKTVKGYFRCHWSQHRSRQKPKGELQQPRHEIADAASNTILENRIRNVAGKVEAVTGMDFERFTRSTLLAQGGFAAFLDASQNEKAPILEQITGTEIYSRISIRVHELHIEELSKLEELEKSLAHINFLAASDEEKLVKVIHEKEKESKLLQTTIADLRKQENWLKDIAELHTQLEIHQKQLKELDKEERDRSREFEQLQPATAAQKIEPLYLEKKHLLESLNDSVLEIQNLKKQLSTLEEQKQGCQKQCETADKLLQQREAAQMTGLELIGRIQKLDHDICTTKDKLNERKKQLKTEQKQKVLEYTAIQTLDQERIQTQNSKDLLEKYFKESAGNERLVEEFGAIKIQIATIMDFQEKLSGFAKIEQTAKHNALTTTHALIKLKKKQDAAQTEATKAKNLLARLTEETKQILQGKVPGSLEQELFQTQNRQKTVQELMLFLENYATQTALKKTLQKQLSTTKQRHQETKDNLLLLNRTQTTNQQEIELLETNLRLLIRIQTLEEDRKQLKDNTPCPLCGSTDHPYQTRKAPDLSKEETRLHRAKTELKNIETEQKEMTRQVTVDEELQSTLSRQIKELETAQVITGKNGEQLLSALDFPPLEHVKQGSITGEEQKLIAHRQTLERQCAHLTKLNEELECAREKNDTLVQTVQKLEKKLLTAEHLASTAFLEKERVMGQEDELAKKLNAINENLFKELALYGFNEEFTIKLPAIQEELGKRATEWKDKKEEAHRLSSRLLTLNATIDHKQKLGQKVSEQITVQEKQCNLIQKNLVELQQDRSTLFGGKETTQEGKRLERAVKDARKALTLSQKKIGENQNQLTASHTLEERLQKEQKSRKQKLMDQEKLFNQALLDSSFLDLEQFLAARIKPEELEKLQKLHNKLQKRKTALQVLNKDKTATLLREKEKQLSKEEPETVKRHIQKQEKQLGILQGQAGAASEQLKQNDTAKAKSAKHLLLIEHQKKRVGRWRRLHMLIGSADGKKFRNFAQGLTFELMVNHANTHLARMNDRYILVRDKEQPLSLNVIDTWQAGEIRSTKNLSGGESFLLSLALALGLSRMASQNVRVDSLFLDEGFGTLDEETLESALDALAGLREEDKLIGIISHVMALKERIPLQIAIIPGSGGRSTIQGPGVRKDD
jgi:DNA repair protein SbcC/Rad50